MTTHSDTHSSFPAPEHISGSGDLLAAVPALLGFVPHRSLVLICFDGAGHDRPSVGTVMRHDLVLTEFEDGRGFGRTIHPRMADVVERFSGICARDGVRVAVALIVDDRAADTVAGGPVDPRFRAVARHLTTHLRQCGTLLTQVFLITELVGGARFVTAAGPPERGALPNPDISPVALAYLLEGRGVHSSRDSLTAVLAPTDSASSREVARRLREPQHVGAGSDRELLEAVLARISLWASAQAERSLLVEPTPDETVDFGIALTHVMVRDSLLALVLTALADAAEQLWTLLTRMLPAPERAPAATLLGFAAYARGDGALAAVAVDIALDADPDYSLARLLDRSLLAGARPDLIREVALSGYAVAELCGVRLPPPLG